MPNLKGMLRHAMHMVKAMVKITSVKERQFITDTHTHIIITSYDCIIEYVHLKFQLAM